MTDQTCGVPNPAWAHSLSSLKSVLIDNPLITTVIPVGGAAFLTTVFLLLNFL